MWFKWFKWFKSKYKRLAEARFRSILRGESPPKLCFSCGKPMICLQKDKHFNRMDYYLCPNCGIRQDVYGLLREISPLAQPQPDKEAEEQREFKS